MFAFFPTREIVFQAFGFDVRWYGVLYVAAFALALYLLPRLQRYRGLQLTFEDWLVVVTWAAVGVVVGGRLGYVVLYAPRYFIAHPFEAFALWQGGMASHGGFVGVGVALWLVCRWYRWNMWQVLDVAMVPVALGLALGRLGNWINNELYVSTFAHVAVIAKDLFIALVAYGYLRWGARWPGVVVGLFLLLYGVLRFLTEYLRFQDYPLVFGLTRGQLFTLPIVVVGGLLVIWRWRLHSEQRLDNGPTVARSSAITSD